jgi:myosin X
MCCVEQNRVVRQNPGERNYHIFYCLLAGADAEVKERLSLHEPSSYHYLNQSGCTSDPTINDPADYQEVLRAFNVMEAPLDQVFEILSMLAAILHLGNVSFVNAGGAQVADKTAVDTCSDLLGLETDRLAASLTQRVMVLRGEEITSPLTVEQAGDSRDSLSMALYASSFRWVLERINAKIAGGDQFANVGILDIFGFENFQVNRFEQFNINFANEKLQEYFNKHIFSLEQHEYSK